MPALEALTYQQPFQQNQERPAAAIADLITQYPDTHIVPVESTGRHAAQQLPYSQERPAPVATAGTPWLSRQPAMQSAPRPMHAQRLPLETVQPETAQRQEAIGRATVVIPGPDGPRMPNYPRSLAEADTGRLGPDAELSPWAYIYKRPSDERDEEGVPLERLRFVAPAPDAHTGLNRLWDMAGIEQNDAAPMRVIKRPGQEPVVSAPAQEMGKISGDRNITSHRREVGRVSRLVRRALGGLMLSPFAIAPIVAFYQSGSAH